MGFACRCDRCGKYMTPRNRLVKQAAIRNFSYFNNNAQYPTDTYDLCDDCIVSLKEWMKAGQEEEKNE